jgi:hypothetical protein
MAITTLLQALLVTDVEDVLVTEIVEDTGLYVREIRVLGEDDKPLLTVRLSSETAEKIRFTTPELSF